MLKGIVNGVEKDIIRMPCIVNGEEKQGWEIRDTNGILLWGFSRTFEGTNSIAIDARSSYATDYKIYGTAEGVGEYDEELQKYYIPVEVKSGDSEASIKIYIGDSKLYDTEYISYKKQKIYKVIDGTLTPTDPESPLPKLEHESGAKSTITVTTSVSPSRFYIYSHSKIASSLSYWEQVRQNVRDGKASELYPIGTILYDTGEDTTGTAFEVVAYDHHFDPTLTAQGFTHSMTLQELYLQDQTIIFDAPEVYLYLDRALPAGTYKFTIGSATRYFTTTIDTTEAVQLSANSTTASSITSLTAYYISDWNKSVWSVTVAELTEDIEATDITEYLHANNADRVSNGSNNYYQSAIRQYLNSSGAAGTWWIPQTGFDRPSSGVSSIAGKLSTLSSEFVDVLATPEIDYITNTVFETSSLDGTTFSLNTKYTITTDKLFLLAPKEINLNYDTSVGTVLDRYVNAKNADRIKTTKSGTARIWWLRTPYPSNAGRVRNVNASGGSNDYRANNSNRPSSACIIQ